MTRKREDTPIDELVTLTDEEGKLRRVADLSPEEITHLRALENVRRVHQAKRGAREHDTVEPYPLTEQHGDVRCRGCGKLMHPGDTVHEKPLVEDALDIWIVCPRCGGDPDAQSEPPG